MNFSSVGSICMRNVKTTLVAGILANFSVMSLTPDTIADTTAIENVAITVHAGERQTFYGLGAGQSMWDAQQGYTSLPPETRDSLARFLWGDLNFRYLRLRSTINECGDPEQNCASSILNSYRPYINDATKFQKDLVVLLSPQGDIGSDFDKYAKSYARQIRILRDSGIVISATGISNEPDWEDLLTAEQVPLLVSAFRRQLDSFDLKDVLILAPENSSADPKAQVFVDYIISDTQAVKDIDIFATHSYNWSITNEMNDLASGYILSKEKQYWMTEASEFGTEQWEDAEQASSALSRLYADLNHLCNVWMFYVGIKGVETDWRMSGHQNTAFYMILYRTEEKDWNYLLKSWYFKQASATIRPGAIVRRASTNLRQIDPDLFNNEDSTMVYAYGRKAPLYLTSAVNTDGSWGIGLTNYTGTIPDTPKTSTVPATSYKVLVTIEELTDSGDIPFTVHRCNASAPYIHPEDSLIMHSGTLTIDSIGQFDMVTLCSPPGTVGARKNMLSGNHNNFGYSALKIQNTSFSGVFSIEVDIRSVSANHNMPVHINAYDSRGRLVSGIFNGFLPNGQHRISWKSRKASSFLIIRMEHGTHSEQVPVIVHK
jgi:hypothetical protein